MEALFIIICRYPLRFSSKITVNGPSFSRDTFISAPKIPCSTTGTCLLASEIIYSYNLFASSGAPASMKLGRFPLRQFAGSSCLYYPSIWKTRVCRIDIDEWVTTSYEWFLVIPICSWFSGNMVVFVII